MNDIIIDILIRQGTKHTWVFVPYDCYYHFYDY
jgi:hypothetical protein